MGRSVRRAIRSVSRTVRRVVRAGERVARGLGNMVGIGETEAEKIAKQEAENNKKLAEQQIEAQKKREEEKLRLDQFNKDIAQQQEQVQETQTSVVEKTPEYDFSSIMLPRGEEEDDKLKKILTGKK